MQACKEGKRPWRTEGKKANQKLLSLPNDYKDQGLYNFEEDEADEVIDLVNPPPGPTLFVDLVGEHAMAGGQAGEPVGEAGQPCPSGQHPSDVDGSLDSLFPDH